MITFISYEYTGDKENGEFLSLTIIDENGNTLFSRTFKPVMEYKWDEHKKGVSMQAVNNSLPIDTQIADIEHYLYDSDLIVVCHYETFIDLLKPLGIHITEKKWIDPTIIYAKSLSNIKGPRGKSVRYIALSVVLKRYGIKFPDTYNERAFAIKEMFYSILIDLNRK